MGVGLAMLKMNSLWYFLAAQNQLALSRVDALLQQSRKSGVTTTVFLSLWTGVMTNQSSLEDTNLNKVLAVVESRIG